MVFHLRKQLATINKNLKMIKVYSNSTSSKIKILICKIYSYNKLLEINNYNNNLKYKIKVC